MNVRIIDHSGNPERTPGQAAAICTASRDPGKSLAHSMEAGHESVLEHAVFTFEITGVSRALLAQLTRHRIASFSVKSQRYVPLGEMPCVIPPTIQRNAAVCKLYTDMTAAIRCAYDQMIACGVPKEDARYITPQGAQTDLIMTMNARELRHFFALRCCGRAQWEIRDLATRMLAACRDIAPALFESAGPECLRTGCHELKSCGHHWKAKEVDGK